jgi:hypothetical protein
LRELLGRVLLLFFFLVALFLVIPLLFQLVDGFVVRGDFFGLEARGGLGLRCGVKFAGRASSVPEMACVEDASSRRRMRVISLRWLAGRAKRVGRCK